jgi:GNAT superfamily N-acetyltransferase
MQNSSKTSSEAETKPPRKAVPTLQFKRLSGRVQRGAFVCGEPEVDRWLTEAHKDHERLKARVVTAHLAGNPNIAAFYGLRLHIEPDEDIDGSGNIFRMQHGYFTAVQLCYIGVQRPLQGNGIGGVVMAHALREFAEVVTRTGVCALTLVAINEKRAAWYERELGFQRYGKPSPRPKMFYPARTALDLIEQNP